jgi:hypothetical protein
MQKLIKRKVKKVRVHSGGGDIRSTGWADDMAVGAAGSGMEAPGPDSSRPVLEHRRECPEAKAAGGWTLLGIISPALGS